MARGDVRIAPGDKLSLTFVRRTVTKDGDGNPAPSEETLATATGAVQPMGGDLRELLHGAQPTSTHVVFTCSRLTADVKQGDVVQWLTYEAEVTAVHDYTGAHKEIEVRGTKGFK